VVNVAVAQNDPVDVTGAAAGAVGELAALVHAARAQVA
jgi:hypothetical protein